CPFTTALPRLATGRLVAPVPSVPESVVFTDGAASQRSRASIEPVFFTATCAMPPNAPGATFGSVSTAGQDGLLLFVEPLPLERQTLFEPTVSLSVSVPEVIALPALVVCALNEAKVPTPPKVTTAPIAIRSARNALNCPSDMTGRDASFGLA